VLLNGFFAKKIQEDFYCPIFSPFLPTQVASLPNNNRGITYPKIRSLSSGGEKVKILIAFFKVSKFVWEKRAKENLRAT